MNILWPEKTDNLDVRPLSVEDEDSFKAPLGGGGAF